MAQEPANTLVTDAEVDAARQEAKIQAADTPSLKAGRDVAIVPTPVEPPPLPQAQAAPTPEPVDPSAGCPTEEELGAEQKAAAVADSRPGVFAPGSVIYRAVDSTLWTLNRPFERLVPPIRNLVGFIALVTIGTSVIAMLLLPRLLPTRDPLSQLTRQAAAVRAAPATTQPAP